METFAARRPSKGDMSHSRRADYSQALLLPLCLEDWVPPEHPARFVRDFVDALDLPALGFRESPGSEGRPHVAADVLLKVWLYGWMDRTRTTRRLEKACLDRMPYIWLSGNLRPDHNTIWRFFRANKPAMRKLFRRVVQVAVDAELVGFALHAIDGTRIQAAASTSRALHRRDLQKALERIDNNIDESIAAIEEGEQTDDTEFRMPDELRDPEQRKARIKESLARLEAAHTDHLHPQDPDARIMKTRQGRLLGYNAQAVADHDSDLIVAEDVVNEAADNMQLVPMIQRVLDSVGRVAEANVADAGYDSGAQIDEAQRRHLPIIINLIPDRIDDGHFSKTRFRYDAENDRYQCPTGKFLPFQRVQPQGKDRPYPRRIYRCRERNCPHALQCSTDRFGRAIGRTPYDAAIERQKESQDTAGARILLSLRKEIIEHAFGNIKQNHGFRRFTVRTILGVRAQWALMCTAHNLNKLYTFWRQGALQLV